MEFKLAVVQMNSQLYAAAANRSRTLYFIDEAASAGASLIVLPELAISGYGLNGEYLSSVAEHADGPTLIAWSECAARHHVWIVGGFCEKGDDGLYNSVLIVGPDGQVGHYRKLHLFDREKCVFLPGDRGLPVYDTPLGRIGLCVCYDLQFVEVARILSLQNAQFVTVPTAWVAGFDRDPFDAAGFVAQARGAVLQANLNQVYIACASQSGSAAEIEFLGSSLVSDPYGEILVPPMARDKEGVGMSLVDRRVAEAARKRSDLIRPREDRRTDLYSLNFDGRRL